YGRNNGFEITAPADSTSRRLRVYAGLYGAQGHFRAWLSDFSAPAFHSHSLSNAVGNDYEVYTLDYAAAEPGQTLTVQYTAESLYDADFGNVTIQAATLQGGGPVLHPVVLLNPTRLGSQFWFSFLTDAGYSYRTETSSALGSGTPWDVLTTLSGTGGTVSVTNQSADAQRFYRVLRQ
ncbi:MAG TPA: hypothetical protein VNM37_06345, partial [Candidatus Dormibacteraeota bacterium]|nr:hypothetical protein [Candidatus Dormibacteraeota bacterium]